MNDLMIDLETLGVNNSCPVISIGAVFFDSNSGLGKSFYKVLNVEEQISSRKRLVDGSTIKWWMGQKDAAQKVFKEGSVSTAQGLQEFVNFIKEHAGDDAKPWGNGSTFDISILESILEDYGVEIPWKFYNIRDLRTYKEFVYDGIDLSRTGTFHNALDDAIYQAEVVLEGIKRKNR